MKSNAQSMTFDTFLVVFITFSNFWCKTWDSAGQAKRTQKWYAASCRVNPNSGGCWLRPHLLDHPKATRKNKIFIFDFVKVKNELGKVLKFGTSSGHNQNLLSHQNIRVKFRSTAHLEVSKYTWIFGGNFDIYAYRDSGANFST